MTTLIMIMQCNCTVDQSLIHQIEILYTKLNSMKFRFQQGEPNIIVDDFF